MIEFMIKFIETVFVTAVFVAAIVFTCVALYSLYNILKSMKEAYFGK